MLPLLDDTICALRERPRNHCRACRENAAFREALLRTHVPPAGGIEICPFGVPTPKSEPPPAAFSARPPQPNSDHPIAELCRWAAKYEPGKGDGNQWLDDFSTRLLPRPREQIEYCRRASPPPLHDRRELQIWVHVLVNSTANKMRGLAPLSLAEADQIWGWQPTRNSIIVPDRIVCLSLDSRPDRWAMFTESCRRSKYLSRWKIERYRARPPAEMIVPDFWTNWAASHWATRQDHLRMLEHSHAAGHENIMVLEDDAIIQPCFDEAYEAACTSLPKDFMGLWLTSDGHEQPPADFAPGLMRSRRQVFLHAYMLSRRGMHRFFSHVTASPGAVIDAATAGLMGTEPHFYSTAQNAVIQIGDRNREAPRTEFYTSNRKANNVIVPPYHGEFGHLILWHTRFVHELKADAKLVCCRKGEECLYPSATGFVYDWPEIGPDSTRCGHGPKGEAPRRDGYTPVMPNYQNWTPWNKFIPKAYHELPCVDVALGVRHRLNPVEAAGNEPTRNWEHWNWLCDELRNRGYTVGLVGHPETSRHILSDTKAWDHSSGHTAGSVDLLRHCRLYIGTDSGATHLAAMCDAPTVGFRLHKSGPDFMRFAQQFNGRTFDRLPDTAWNDRDAVLAAALRRLRRPTVTMLTGCDESFRPITEPTLPGKRSYCERHRLRFVDRPYVVTPWGSREELMLEELPKADWLWFLDADTIVMNHAIDIRTVIDPDYDCIIGVDVYGINNGSMLLRNCPATMKFVQDVLALRGTVANDQIAMKRVMDATPGYRVKFIGQRAFNSYIETEYGRPDDERYAYRQGDLLLHLPGMPSERRLQLIGEYVEKVQQ